MRRTNDFHYEPKPFYTIQLVTIITGIESHPIVSEKHPITFSE